MISSRIIFISALILFLICGCAQKLQKTSVYQHKNSDLSELKSPPDTKPTYKANNTTNKSVLINLTKTNHRESEVKGKKYTANNSENNSIIDKKLSSEKKIQTVLDEALDFCQASQDFWQKSRASSRTDCIFFPYKYFLSIVRS